MHLFIFIESTMPVKLISRADIQQCISMPQAIEVMKDAFLQLANQEVIQPLRTALSVSGKGAMLTMPAYLERERQLGIKLVSSFPDNRKHNLPNIHGLIVLIDASNGVPLALMEAGYLTALRTGAVSGLATDLLAKKDAKSLCIIGAGAQARTQLEAVVAVRNIEKITIWSRTYQHAFEFSESYQHQFCIEPVLNIQSAVRDADIICTATNSDTPLVYSADIKPDVHINAVGSHAKSMQEIGLDVLQKAMIVVDQKEAALVEAGEVITAIESGYVKEKQLMELGELLQHPNSAYLKQLTLFKSVGLAIQDISIASCVYQNAVKDGLGFSWDLF